MYPVLEIGPLSIQTYLLALIVAFWTGLALAVRLAGRAGMDGDHINNAGLLGLVGAVVVGRLAHVVTFWPAYRDQLLEIVGLNTRAFLWPPALIGGLVIAGIYLHHHRLSLAAVLDAAAPGALLALAIAQIGAFLAGVSIGTPTSLPWAVTVWSVPRHPVQLYASAGFLTALGATLLFQHRGGLGSTALIAFLGYGLTVWLFEPFRAESAVILGGLRAFQVLGLAVALLALYLLRPAITGPIPRQDVWNARD